ncbi:polysaccharide deacetylase family protein [Bacillus songklensis]|uniref:Polysaccharide deacetylase family protein n=1 Tax=Bacillus songklensis TaxID=1069116 RepID=A0ABV8B839_9BACI
MIMLKKLGICLLLVALFLGLSPDNTRAKAQSTYIEMKYNHVLAYQKVGEKLRPYMILNPHHAYKLEGSASRNWYKLKVEGADIYVAKIRTKKALKEHVQDLDMDYQPTNRTITPHQEIPVFVNDSTNDKVFAHLLKEVTYPVLFEKDDFYVIDIAGVKGFALKSAVDITKEELAYTKAVPVLMYHHLLKKAENQFPNNNVILNVENFEEQMKYLASQGYKTITIDELIRYMNGEIRLPNKSILITFDDGHKTNYLYAYPILKKYNMHAAAFIITNRIQPQPAVFDPSRLQFLSVQEMQAMRDVFEFGSHTNGLHNLEGMTSQVLLKSPEELLDDFGTSRAILQTSYFCYPFGQYNEQTVSLVKQSGYQAAFTTKTGYAEPHESLYDIERFGVYPYTTMEEFKRIVGGFK